MKKAAVVMALLMILSCAGVGEVEEFKEDALSSAESLSDALLVEDLYTDLNLSSYLLSPPSFSPPLTPPSPQYAKPLLVFLVPHPVRNRRVLLRIVRAPLRISHYYGSLFYAQTLPSCISIQQEGACPVKEVGDTCYWTYEFSQEGCAENVFVNGATTTINFSGSMTGVVNLVNPNVISIEVFSESLRIEGEHERFIEISGTSKGTFNIGFLGYTFTLEAKNVFFEDSEGRKGVINGTRTVEVNYGKNIIIAIDGNVNITSPNGEEHELEFDIDKTIEFGIGMKSITLSDTTTMDGNVFTREWNLNVSKELNEGEVLKEITLEGSGRYEGPVRTLEVDINNIVLDVNCDRNPRGGSIEVKGPEHTAVITFENTCSCFAWLSIDGDEPQKVDMCNRKKM